MSVFIRIPLKPCQSAKLQNHNAERLSKDEIFVKIKIRYLWFVKNTNSGREKRVKNYSE